MIGFYAVLFGLPAVILALALGLAARGGRVSGGGGRGSRGRPDRGTRAMPDGESRGTPPTNQVS